MACCRGFGVFGDVRMCGEVGCGLLLRVCSVWDVRMCGEVGCGLLQRVCSVRKDERMMGPIRS